MGNKEDLNKFEVKAIVYNLNRELILQEKLYLCQSYQSTEKYIMGNRKKN